MPFGPQKIGDFGFDSGGTAVSIGSAGLNGDRES